MSFPLLSFRRILLKISGEFLQGHKAHGLCYQTLSSVCEDICFLQKTHQIAIVLGGGNFFRGAHHAEFSRQSADAIGLLATCMNAYAMQSVLTEKGARVQLHSTCTQEGYNGTKAAQALNEGQIVLCAGGTGNAFFTTDTAAVVRALETRCDVLLKGSDVDGVYTKDPHQHTDAVFLPTLTYEKAIEQRLAIMDTTAFTLAQENNLPLMVFSLKKGLRAFIENTTPYTYIHAA